MAGMLPGVECARRRRIHQSGNRLIDSSSYVTSTTSFGYASRRPSSFCLYVTSRYQSPPLFPMEQINATVRPADFDEKLDDAAREAKERLDEKLNATWKSTKTRFFFLGISYSYFFF
ncbi:hypothetical protein Leryth_021005 [Lithospermum erythrorhizon]|nr:hypothetical protein Leryth_021005 [Lithospermum erythrorhizon]